MLRSPLLLAAAFVTAVAAGSLFSPQPSCATTGGCLIPTFAVSQYLNVTGNDILSGLSSNVRRCREQCDELLNGCQGVVKAAERCVKAAAGAETDADERGCNDLSKPDAGPCKRDARSEEREIFGFVSDDASNAIDDCFDAHDDCNLDCEDEELED
jgi:hypothetical protein